VSFPEPKGIMHVINSEAFIKKPQFLLTYINIRGATCLVLSFGACRFHQIWYNSIRKIL